MKYRRRREPAAMPCSPPIEPDRLTPPAGRTDQRGAGRTPSAGALLRALVLGAVCLLGTRPALALDEVVLSNGRRYLGTIVSDSPQSLVLSIDGGTVEFPRSAVVSPPYLGTTGVPVEAVEPPPPKEAARHPVPGVAVALQRLREFPWGGELRQVPVLVTDRGRWQQLPCVSFWVGGFFQMSFFGDPARPAVIELALLQPPPEAWEEKRRLLEFAYALVPGLATDNRFDRLELRGDSFAVGDLWFAVTAPESNETPGRWTLVLMHEVSIAPSRGTGAELLAISEPVQVAMLDPSQPRSWQKGSWTPAELAWLRDTSVAPPAANASTTATVRTPLGNERIFVRSFTRVRGHYARSNEDWLRETASAP